MNHSTQEYQPILSSYLGLCVGYWKTQKSAVCFQRSSISSERSLRIGTQRRKLSSK